MSINKLGRINFPSLDDYTWKAADFEVDQEYLEAYLFEIVSANWGAGLVYGGGISLSSGLTISVAKLLAIFSTNQPVTMDVATISVGAADPTNPRIDRIELGFSLVNNSNVVNVDGVTQVFDKVVTAQLFVNPGTPAGSPVAPSLTAGRISLGLVTVNATQTLLTSASFDQSELARTISRKAEPSEVTASLANNQSAFADVKDLQLNSAITRRETIKGYVYLVTGSNELMVGVTLEAQFKPVAATWALDVTFSGPDISAADGLDFQILSTGKVQYKTPNVAGSSFVGSFKYRVSAQS